MNEQVQKQCPDCIYYLQHYIVLKDKPHLVNCGHCRSPHPNGKFRKTDKLCEKFEDKETNAKLLQ